MIHRAHVVIIGAGMIGLSCAYWLSKFGVEDIVVVDRSKTIGAGATKTCAGVMTQNFSDHTMIKLAIESRKLYRDITCGLESRGHIAIYEDPGKAEAAKTLREHQKKAGISVQEVEGHELYEHIPAARHDDINYALFYKGDATADVQKVMDHFKEGCPEVEFLFETAVTHIKKTDDGFDINTNRGILHTEKIINCAGAYAGVIGHFAGIDVPVLPLRMHGIITQPIPSISSRMPIVSDERYDIKIIPHAGAFYLLQMYEHEQHGFFKEVEEHFIYDIMFDAEKRFPDFANTRVKDKFAGYYAMTPDHKPIIGEAEKNFFNCCGFSGHGFTFAPVVGMVIADLIVHPTSRHDITGLELKRFRK